MVIHLAARAGGIQFQEGGDTSIFASNRRITDNVLAACLRSRVSRLFLASSSVIYQPSDEPITESWPVLGPDDDPDPYAWSKITDEVVARWHEGLHTVIGRFGNVYGPGAAFEHDRSTVVHGLIDRAARARDEDDLVVWGDGSAIRSFVYIEDAARAVLIALEKGVRGEAYNIDSGIGATIGELAASVRDAVNPALALRFEAAMPAGMPSRVGSIAKLAALGYSPVVRLDDGVRRTADWYRTSIESSGGEGPGAHG
jgi:GDP-L-fucose synthase